MSYYCSNCKKTHPGWPSIEFAYPEEYCRMDEKERKLRCFSIDDGLKIVHKKDHVHYYARINWPQRVRGSMEIWHWKVWVMVEDDNVISDLRKGIIPSAPATLQSNFPWHHGYFIGFPITIKYDHADCFPIIDRVVYKKSSVYDDFTYGVPLSVANELSEDVANNSPWKCPG